MRRNDLFFADTPSPVDILQHREHESLFLTWLGLRFAPATSRGPRIPAPRRPRWPDGG